jgi:glycosyltransferase involved in cell wall biosynthesis
MKIALTLPHLPLSGVGTSIAIIEAGLSGAGYKVDVVITGNHVGGDLGFAEKSGWNLFFPGRGIRFLPERLKRIAEFLNSNEYSVVLNNTSAETQLVLPCLRSEILRVGVMRVLNPSALKHLAMNSAYLHTAVGISAEMTRVMEADSNIKAPVRLIPNCTCVKGGDLPLLSDRIKICYVGRISNPDKNVMILPRVAKSLKSSGVNFSLEIVGDGPARKNLERDFKRLVPGCANFKGLLPREEAQQVMSKSNFVLLPSFSEGLSNVMLEGMALGCVPVCSDIENFKWVLGDVADRLQCPLHVPEDYAQKIIHMFKNPDVYSATQLYLRERQLNLFTPETTVQGYQELINELKSEKKPDLPLPCDFAEMRIPKEYRRYCSPWWQLLQKAKDIIKKNAFGL